ncbi:hypothetical protein O6H91_Y088300 [Diphasiastrum complanatum]|nr:hypothetical protein O6H91_Y088300 [Diphasiastrum complanatum]
MCTTCKHGISACFLGSGQPDKSVEGKAMAGAYSIVYVCPETFTRVIPSLQVLARGRGIALFAVDEAHCISKWGHDFRPEYRRLSVIREKFRMDANEGSRRTIPIMALTATATERVRADILESLGIDKTGPKIIVTTLFRPNLKFSVHHSKTTRCASYQADFKELIEMYGNYRQDMPVSRDSGQQNSSRIVIDVIMSPSAQTNQTCKTSLPDGKSGTSSQNCLQSNSFHATESEAEEDEEDMERTQGDFDGGCAEFPSGGPSTEAEPKYNHLDGDCELFGCGPTIIYMPTRKETERLASFLSTCSVKAAAYHAKVTKWFYVCFMQLQNRKLIFALCNRENKMRLTSAGCFFMTHSLFELLHPFPVDESKTSGALAIFQTLLRAGEGYFLTFGV